VELKNKPDWNSSDNKFVVEYDVKIPGWASSAGKRALVPLGLFSNAQKHTFEHAHRTYAVVFSYMFQTEDQTRILVPAGWKVDSLPKETHIDVKAAEYLIHIENNDNALQVTRTFRSDVLLVQGRREPSPGFKQKVTELTAGKTDTLAKMQALSNYVQRDIRYVAIALRIGGWQPHPARDIFNNHYGDCKDKATLLSTMLKEIGVDSYYVVVNTSRGVVNAETPPQHSFDHIILAIHLPADLKDSPLKSVYTDSELGRILIFDPTDELTPLGGPLQGSYALLVDPDNGELIQLPILSPQSSGVHRSGKLTLDANGMLSGEFPDLLYGDYAAFQRYAYREMTKKEDQIKPIETLLSHSVDTYQITKAAIGNLGSIVVHAYAKTAGLLLVRPGVLGEKARDVLEKRSLGNTRLSLKDRAETATESRSLCLRGIRSMSCLHPWTSTIPLAAIAARPK
jgi:Transglutaminase-like superfamily